MAKSADPSPSVAMRKCIKEAESNGHHDVCILKRIKKRELEALQRDRTNEWDSRHIYTLDKSTWNMA
jgi:hypothetical protein